MNRYTDQRYGCIHLSAVPARHRRIRRFQLCASVHLQHLPVLFTDKPDNMFLFDFQQLLKAEQHLRTKLRGG